jgi:hypothetical protein
MNIRLNSENDVKVDHTLRLLSGTGKVELFQSSPPVSSGVLRSSPPVSSGVLRSSQPVSSGFLKSSTLVSGGEDLHKQTRNECILLHGDLLEPKGVCARDFLKKYTRNE